MTESPSAAPDGAQRVGIEADEDSGERPHRWSPGVISIPASVWPSMPESAASRAGFVAGEDRSEERRVRCELGEQLPGGGGQIGGSWPRSSCDEPLPLDDPPLPEASRVVLVWSDAPWMPPPGIDRGGVGSLGTGGRDDRQGDDHGHGAHDLSPRPCHVSPPARLLTHPGAIPQCPDRPASDQTLGSERRRHKEGTSRAQEATGSGARRIIGAPPCRWVMAGRACPVRGPPRCTVGRSRRS